MDNDKTLRRIAAALERIADALGIDDKHFVSHHFVFQETRKGGQVRIRITGTPQKGEV